MINVVVIDDSFFLRRIIKRMLTADPDICVVAEAKNGEEGLKMIVEHKPDVVCLDIIMPGLDGVSTLEKIIRRAPTPVIVFSSLVGAQADIAKEVTRIGVVGMVQKPSQPENLPEVRTELIAQIKTAYEFDRRKLIERYDEYVKNPIKNMTDRLLLIYYNDNNPLNLEVFLKTLPKYIPAGIVIFHNFSKQFVSFWAEHLKATLLFHTSIAGDGDRIAANKLLFVPSGSTVKIAMIHQGGVVQVVDAEHCISSYADTFFESAAVSYKEKVVAAVLTDIDKEGVAGIEMIKKNKGKVLIKKGCNIADTILENNLHDGIIPVENLSREVNTLLMPK